MPSYSLNQFTDLEEMMCKQLLGLDLREQNGPLSMAMKTPGYIGQRSNSSFSLSSLCPSESSDIFPSPSQWRQSPESPLSPQLPNSTQWGKTGFLTQRSISMVETNSMAAASLCWPGSDLSTAALSSSSLSASSVSSSSTSSRYKTELCRSFTENGLCKYGSKCQFAHGMDELRDLNRHPKYKTLPCRTFHTIGFCPYGIRCHFVHNNEEERNQSITRSSSSPSSSSTGVPNQTPSTRSNRPPLIRHSFSFAGFPSAPQGLQSAHPGSAFTRAPSASPPACADITDLLSQAFLELDFAFEASPAHQQYQPPQSQTSAGDPRSPFLPSPDSGCSSPTLRQSPGAPGAFGPLGTRSLSYTSLSDQDQDGGSSSSSLSGSEPCCGLNEASGRRLAVFSQLSVPDDPAAFFI
ncbi:mRNA decay activator protein ZFP36L1 [Boleophthalmus pectinirostris]|uniref:mRNA decay activator protein ZFP36L1 n=1 Tax=Boleophthalmus pectinirostris TaxID=150288 RepID=UPI00242B707D|nr:mRNA decay activator protein ZFP36L1 [Boleophthalmus pectinirostris]